MKIYPARLTGSVRAPLSKSVLHRELIYQALCGAYPVLPDVPEDIAATVRALSALRRGDAVIDCGESGSTLRFLLPVAAALGRVGTVFTGSERLRQRPIPAGLPIEKEKTGWRITAPLQPGKYTPDASGTSQVVSGLLLALPLLQAPSEIELLSPVSAGYIALTAAALQRYGIMVSPTEKGYRIPAPQRYAYAPIAQEGDWSAAAWYIAVNALSGGKLVVEGLSKESLQPDKAIIGYCEKLPDTVDISEAPDLFPVLALLAALQPGKLTCFTRGSYLRGKESDRLHNVQTILNALGARVTATFDGVVIQGVSQLYGGVTLSADGDHRMAFLAAFAALFCASPVTLLGADCVKKSYPRFWEDYAALGGVTEE